MLQLQHVSAEVNAILRWWILMPSSVEMTCDIAKRFPFPHIMALGWTRLTYFHILFASAFFQCLIFSMLLPGHGIGSTKWQERWYFEVSTSMRRVLP